LRIETVLTKWRRREGAKMTNKEWLENIKRVDDKRKPSDLIPIYEFRKAKALEIIAEELIKLNENFGLLEKVYDKSEKAIRVTND
jgi:hypothetical protein